MDALRPEQLRALRQIGETIVDRAFDTLGDALPFERPWTSAPGVGGAGD